jgi:hypothetical protein
MLEKEPRFTTQEVCERLKIPMSFLVELTRIKRGKPPLFVPHWPSECRGKTHSDYYSLQDIIHIGVFVKLTQLGFSRSLILKITTHEEPKNGKL